MRANSWLYHYYMVQSRLQYGLAYGAHAPAALSSLYYPHVQVRFWENKHLGDIIDRVEETVSQLSNPGLSMGGSQPLFSSGPLSSSHLSNSKVSPFISTTDSSNICTTLMCHLWYLPLCCLVIVIFAFLIFAHPLAWLAAIPTPVHTSTLHTQVEKSNLSKKSSSPN